MATFPVKEDWVQGKASSSDFNKVGAGVNQNHTDADANANVINNNILQIFGVSTPVMGGTPPPAGNNGFKIQAGSNVVNMGGLAHQTITFPAAFSTGVLTVLVADGDSESSGGSKNIAVTAVDVTKTNFKFRAVNEGAALIGGSIQVNWFAIGW